MNKRYHVDNQAPLRFGILCRSLNWADWQYRVVDALVTRQIAAPELVVVDGVRRPRNELSRLPFRIYRRLVHAKLSSHKARDGSPLAGNAPQIRCDVIRKGKFSEYFADDDVARIQSFKLDFMLRFGFGIVRGRILTAARFGVWSYHHDDERVFRGTPPLFWALYHGYPTCGAVLQRLTNRLDGGVILRRGTFSNEATYPRTIDKVYNACPSWVASAALQIKNGDLSAVNAEPTSSKAAIVYPPNTLQLGVFACRQGARKIRSQLKRFFVHNKWNVGTIWGIEPKDVVEKGLEGAHIEWQRELRRGEYIADPAVLDDPPQKHLLVEHLDWQNGIGSIRQSVLEPCASGVALPQSVVMPRREHISYPYVFQDDQGRTCCIVECEESNCVPLYWYDVPSKTWVEDTPLIEKPLVDPTIFIHDGLWWLLGGLPKKANYELNAWWSHDPRGDWTPHPLNPIKVDVQSSRCAGKPFQVDGQLFRPAQDCAKSYGAQISINRIDVLSRSSFLETPVRIIRPTTKYPHGLHTLSFFSDGLVLDGKKQVFSIATPALRMQRWLRTRKRREIAQASETGSS